MITVAFCGPAIFGAALGYIMMSMFVVHERNLNWGDTVRYEERLKPTWGGITTFIAVALSSTIVQAFPQLTDFFWTYAMGIGIGVFARELKRLATLFY